MDKFRKAALPVEIKDADDDSRSFWIVASDESVDRDGDSIKADGWDLTNFKKNPVIPWAHRYGDPPVAKAADIKVEDGKLMIKAQFAAADDYPFADTIYRLYKGGFLSAFSVGFKPTKWTTVDEPGRWGWDIEKAELYEVSAVTVPANPNAVALAVSKGVITEDEARALEPPDMAARLKDMDVKIDALTEKNAAIEKAVKDLTETPTKQKPESTPEPEPEIDTKTLEAALSKVMAGREDKLKTLIQGEINHALGIV